MVAAGATNADLPDLNVLYFLAIMPAGYYKMKKINLRQMKKNQTATIIAVKATGVLGRRIREMGLVPGASITIQGRAPLNDPVALRLLGGTLTLRNNEADFITVSISD